MKLKEIYPQLILLFSFSAALGHKHEEASRFFSSWSIRFMLPKVLEKFHISYETLPAPVQYEISVFTRHIDTVKQLSASYRDEMDQLLEGNFDGLGFGEFKDKESGVLKGCISSLHEILTNEEVEEEIQPMRKYYTNVNRERRRCTEFKEQTDEKFRRGKHETEEEFAERLQGLEIWVQRRSKKHRQVVAKLGKEFQNDQIASENKWYCKVIVFVLDLLSKLAPSLNLTALKTFLGC